MSAVLEINLSYLTHNYHYLRSKITPGVKFLAVVKAIAYGSDSIRIAQHLEQLGVDYFGVAYAEEGVELRKNGITTPILVLHAQPHNYKLIVENNLEPNLYSFHTVKSFASFCKENKIENYPVHIKFNSGLNRLGVALNEVSEIKKQITEAKLKTTSLMSHLAASEDLNEANFTKKQIDRFILFQKAFLSDVENTSLIHQCNTSGILNFPKAHFNMVRAGIGLYGFGNDADYDKNLKPIAKLTAKISQIRELKKGDTLSYNRKFTANNSIRTATITVGHADGIDRIYGNSKGYVVINNQKAPILGVVCMDMLMVEVTSIDCKEGDTAIIFNEKYTASELAEAVGTISYELITGIGPRVKRIITNK